MVFDIFIKSLLKSKDAKQFCNARLYDKVSRNNLKHAPDTFHFTALILEPIVWSIIMSLDLI